MAKITIHCSDELKKLFTFISSHNSRSESGEGIHMLLGYTEPYKPLFEHTQKNGLPQKPAGNRRKAPAKSRK